MKTNTFLFFIIITIVFISCSQVNEDSYLKTVLNNLERIESATYQTKEVGWNPYDADPFYEETHNIVEYNNPSDTTIGASYVTLRTADTTLFSAYDGEVRIVVWDEKKTLGIDNFSVNRFNLPFRLVHPPFYNYTKNIIDYILNTTDSITVEKHEIDNSLHIILTIHEDRQVEFFGKAYKMPSPPMFGEDPTSRYEIWIDRTTNLPYKYRREMSHDKKETTVFNPHFNKDQIDNFHVTDYFPADYETIAYKDALEKRSNRNSHDLEGKVATNFSLTDTQNNEVSLKDISSKVILLQFTGIGCGPCLMSIPFMEKISKEYSDDQLTVLSIETWSRKIGTMQNYQEKNKFTYTFLKSDDNITEAYNAMGVPKFYVLDDERVINVVFDGYTENTTDNEIRKAIDILLNN